MSEAFPITIFHNPDCGTSRNTLAMIKAAGYAPTVIEYLKVGWTPRQLAELLAAMDAAPRDILREKARRPQSLDCWRQARPMIRFSTPWLRIRSSLAGRSSRRRRASNSVGRLKSC